MADGTGTPPSGSEVPQRPTEDERSVSELVFDVAEKSSSLVREEIELAKTEISEKVGKILRGSVVGIAAYQTVFCTGTVIAPRVVVAQCPPAPVASSGPRFRRNARGSASAPDSNRANARTTR